MGATYVANKNYILREIAGEAILVSVGEQIADFCGIVNLNASAKILWETLQREVTKEELVETFIREFQVSKEKALEDIEISLQIMMERGLVANV